MKKRQEIAKKLEGHDSVHSEIYVQPAFDCLLGDHFEVCIKTGNRITALTIARTPQEVEKRVKAFSEACPELTVDIHPACSELF